MKAETKRRRTARRAPLRQRWAAASNIERFTWIVWWTLCGVFGCTVGLVVAVVVTFAF